VKDGFVEQRGNVVIVQRIDDLKAIRQNLAFSLGVLGIAVVLTIPGILTPVSAALLHELSAIPVIATCARLITRRG
jgi:cation transport ATPase